jgi:PKD repeat protein
MMPLTSGEPDPVQRRVFVSDAFDPVHLEIGPGGDLFYVDIGGGTVRRIQYFADNTPPLAVATSDQTFGPVPLTVQFDGSASSDEDGDVLTYAWDLNGDGAYDDSTEVSPTYTYAVAGDVSVGLRVTDPTGATGEDTILISLGSSPPTPTMVLPEPGTTWQVGKPIEFSGTATDADEGTLPASALSWELVLHHCTDDGGCHAHPIQTFEGVDSGTVHGVDHEYPSYIQITLTATDAAGLESSVSMDLLPDTVDLRFESAPSGLELAVGQTSEPTPFTRTVIVGSSNSLTAPSSQSAAGTDYTFSSWSDGGAATHIITAPAAPTTYTATYATPTLLYLSLVNAGTVGGISAANEDILSFNGTAFSLTFDGSDVGVGGLALDAFALISGSDLLMSFTSPGSIPGISGTVDDSDIVRFTATSLGASTSGSFSLYFDGSDVGLSTNAEDVDAIDVLPDGRLLVSTMGSFGVSGVSGADEDLIGLTGSFGPTTSGTWAMYFDGSDVGLSGSGENVDAVAVDSGGKIHLSTAGGFSVSGASGTDEDVFVFVPTALGSTTQGSYAPVLFFDGSTYGLDGNDLQAVDLP